VPFRFTGTLAKLTVDLRPVPLSDVDQRALEGSSQRNNKSRE